MKGAETCGRGGTALTDTVMAPNCRQIQPRQRSRQRNALRVLQQPGHVAVGHAGAVCIAVQPIVSVQGRACVVLSGAVFAPGAEIDFGGSSCGVGGGSDAIATLQFLCWDLALAGTTTSTSSTSATPSRSPIRTAWSSRAGARPGVPPRHPTPRRGWVDAPGVDGHPGFGRSPSNNKADDVRPDRRSSDVGRVRTHGLQGVPGAVHAPSSRSVPGPCEFGPT